MAAITVTSVSLIADSRAVTNRSKQSAAQSLESGSFAAEVPFRVSSGTSAASLTDTFTLALDARTTSITFTTRSTTGTIAVGGTVALQANDTVGLPLPPLTAGGVYISPKIPVAGGQTMVITTGTLAVAGNVIVVYQYAPKGIVTPNVLAF